MSETETFEIEFTGFAYGGEAMGRLPDGRAVFTPFVLPGEIGRIRLIEQRRGFARGQLIELLRPSPDRIAPRCAHFGVCGGCHYQHLPYERQLAAKAAILSDQLQRIGGDCRLFPSSSLCLPPSRSITAITSSSTSPRMAAWVFTAPSPPQSSPSRNVTCRSLP